MGFSCVLWEKEILDLGRLEKIFSIFFNFGVVYYLGFNPYGAYFESTEASFLKV